MGQGAGLRQNNKYDIVPTFRQRTEPDYHFYSLGQNHTYFLSLEVLRISALIRNHLCITYINNQRSPLFTSTSANLSELILVLK